ncbi:MAG: hypothetical protein ABEI13_03750 [Candidatus Paceibacteria bacterium]
MIIEYGEANSGRNHIVNLLLECWVQAPQAGGAAEQQQAPNARTFVEGANIQILQSVTAIARQTSVVENSYVIPSFYQGEVVIMNTQYLGVQLENWFVGHIRRLVTNRFIFKKVRIFVYDPPVGGGDVERRPLPSRRRT